MSTKKKKRRDPAELVASSPKAGSWYDVLNDTDRDYVHDIMIAMRGEPHVSISSVARSLIEELGLSVSATSVREILKKMA